jgi:hypothetical protein
MARSRIILCIAHNPFVRVRARFWLLPSRVRAAFFAASDLSSALRRTATDCVCWESALLDTTSPVSRLSARIVARARLGEGDVFTPDCAAEYSLSAFRRVSSETVPFFGGGSFTPARRALDSPMAMACLVDRAPCLPSRISSISSRTNSPAWVEGAFPSCAAWRARARVFFLGISWKIRSLQVRFLQSSIDKNSSRCRCMNSARALCAVAEGSRKWAIVLFRQTHSSTASETSFCLLIPRKSHCFASHSNCCELISIRSEALASSGSSGDDPDSFFRTN